MGVRPGPSARGQGSGSAGGRRGARLRACGRPARVTAPRRSPRPVHHFNLGRRIPGFDYGPDGFGTGLTPLHLSDDGEGGTFHFHDPPPPYTAYKYPDIDQPDDPPPPYEASINPDSVFYDPAGDPRGVGAAAWAPFLPLRWPCCRGGWAHPAPASLPGPLSRALRGGGPGRGARVAS